MALGKRGCFEGRGCWYKHKVGIMESTTSQPSRTPACLWVRTGTASGARCRRRLRIGSGGWTPACPV